MYANKRGNKNQSPIIEAKNKQYKPGDLENSPLNGLHPRKYL
jgi:hypothetical protein